MLGEALRAAGLIGPAPWDVTALGLVMLEPLTTMLAALLGQVLAWLRPP